ncbi:MAG: hypothetical protein FWC42_05125 [Proteobacteria bacterium]|nr:hypothetical protein [Pseudomonadota bacterium]
MALLLFLIAVQIWAGYNTNGMDDTYRDLHFAQNIMLGLEFPLNGPPVYSTIHLGPLWFYLLAVPLWLTGSPAIVQAFIGLLGALKFPLAYRLGHHFGSARLSLFFALALLYPGWSSFIFVTFTHSAMAETTLLLGALAALYYVKKQTWGAAALLGLAVALMMHAHPTTLLLATVMALLALFGCYQNTAPDWKKQLLHLIIVAFFSLLPLVPMLIGQALLGFPDFHALTQYGERDLAWPSLQRTASVLLAIFLYGAAYITHYWLEFPLPLSYGLFAALCGSLALVLWGLIKTVKQTPQRRILVVALLIALLGQTFFVVLLRPITPFWMIYSHWPLIAALCALGLDNLYNGGSRGRVLVGLTLFLWFSWSMAGFSLIGRAQHNFFIDTPQSLININELALFGKGANVTIARLPVSEILTTEKPLCQPTTLYGHYAYFVDTSFGFGAKWHCRKTQQILLGGSGGTKAAWVGMRDYAWSQAGIIPQKWLGSLGIVAPEKIWSVSESLPIGDPTFANNRKHQREISSKEFVVHAEVPPNQAILVAKRWGPIELRSALANDEAVAPAYQDIFGFFLFKTPATAVVDEKVRWAFVLYGDPRYIDVVSFKAENSKN